ncbi:phage repressor protein/antirepressor Ant [Haemophilus influenzae]|uniref:phage repressor protein/antirepressor Ant n=1 Tax=Haemophilus influenzae TaxID=727 RepID=UPI0001DDDF03|nr:phage repressor protein/antirepressor Ant [Haemophilus influenzae]CVQ11798.1 phage antirepressor protein [Streptococcus pneumoniae]CBW28528.1 putative antirepressor protein encoded by prophage cp-933n (putative antirepressor protein) [Haemophilus influenzae 10810]CWW94607.1 putative antirepressor protein encoded by prophage cp-933n (putative antirepressor protein) [Haemophilus influenzae]CWX14528.1 putative antirepressor protein encoded by prophage cp-933n (putative antirepressor protein) [H
MSNQSQLSTFNFESKSIRTLAINNEPWFVAKDVCDAIGIDNNRKALLALDEDEKGVTLSYTLGGQQEMNIISESGMYTLILRCRDAVKKGSIPHRFRKWVTAEVLPTIRKTGKYESKTSVNDRTGLRNAVNMLVSKKGLIYSDAYHLIHQRFNVESIEDLTLEQLPQAVEYVHRIVLEGELITTPKKDECFNFEFTERELQHLVWAWFALLRGTELCQVLHPALKQIGSHYAASVYGVAYEYRSTLRQAHNVLTRITEQFECEQGNNWRVLKHLRAYNPKATGFQLDIL